MKLSLLSAVILLVSVLHWMPFVAGQTFQYSRGWTNGKRSETYPWAEPLSAAHNKSLADNSASLDAENNAAITTDSFCSNDRTNIITLSHDRMLQLIAYSMRKHKFINVVVCVDPITPSTHMHVDF